ncbi:MAG: hypothetical protein JSS53_09380 [Proteobacteria bacterium]|nr:hypothetical protein [Pseudomonadota bacterium]
MNILQDITLWFFSVAMFINGMLFLPQAVKIIQKKSAKDISLITFAGFCFIQLSSVIHGFVEKDYALMWGMGYSFITCGIVIILAIVYRKQ